MKASELRDMTVSDLDSELKSTLEKQFNLRMNSNSGQEVSSHLFKEYRRQVARIKTVLKEKSGD